MSENDRWLSIQQISQLIASSKVFLGAVSSCNAIAEGLGKNRFVEQSADCFNVQVPDGHCINGWSNEAVISAVVEACR
jgi:hypothetical protein